MLGSCREINLGFINIKRNVVQAELSTIKNGIGSLLRECTTHPLEIIIRNLHEWAEHTRANREGIPAWGWRLARERLHGSSRLSSFYNFIIEF